MSRSIELLEPGIIRIAWDGVVSRESYLDGIMDRKRFADEQRLERYVLIFDLREARVNIMDVRLAAWSVNADPRMTHTLVISKSPMVTVTVNTMLRLTKVQVELVNTPERALDRARQIVAEWNKG